jgi:hypothetical protein
MENTNPPQDNQEPFWKQRFRNAGRPQLFESPEMLKEAADEYFEATAKRYWSEEDWIQSGKQVTRKKSPPFTIAGFCLFVGASRNWWNEMKTREEKIKGSKFLGVIRYISDTVELQQFEGASIGAFNANIISRALGLVDKTQSDVTTTRVFKVGYKKPDDNE